MTKLARVKLVLLLGVVLLLVAIGIRARLEQSLLLRSPAVAQAGRPRSARRYNFLMSTLE